MTVDYNKFFGGLLFAFIGLIVGIVFLSTLSDLIVGSTQTTNVQNESIAITSKNQTVSNEAITTVSGTNTTAHAVVVNVTFFGNDTVNTTTGYANLTVNVNFTRLGVITVTESLFTDGLYNISYLFSVNATGSTAHGNVTSVSFFGNDTLNTSLSGISIGTHVNVSSRGNINVTPANFSDGNYNITYNYEGLQYVRDRSSRAILPLIPIFFALFVFLFGVVLVLQSGVVDSFK